MLKWGNWEEPMVGLDPKPHSMYKLLLFPLAACHHRLHTKLKSSKKHFAIQS